MKKNPQLNWPRLPLEGVENCRELGGYVTKTGEQVNWHTFLRANDMNGLTANDISFLEGYGVKTVIDLRWDVEINASPNPLAKETFCTYHHIPFAEQPIQALDELSTFTMGDFYVKMLEESKNVKQIFASIDQAAYGATVFHCSAGKDRTGVLAMLLLGLAGVDKRDIVANYEVTYTMMNGFQGRKNPNPLPKNISEKLLYSDRAYIIQAYDHIIDNYENFENYLLAKGIEQAVINRIKIRLGLTEVGKMAE